MVEIPDRNVIIHIKMDQAAALEEQRNVLYSDLQALQKERRELDTAKQNVDIIMNDNKKKVNGKRKEWE